MISVFFVFIVLFIGACSRTFVVRTSMNRPVIFVPALGRSVPRHKFRRGAARAGSIHSESYHPAGL